MIIDGGSCSNLALEELVEKLNLKLEAHPNPYQIAWVNDTSILVSSHCLVTFNFSNNFELSAWCDVLPMKVAHIMLGFFMKGSNMMNMRTLTHLCAIGIRRSFIQ